MEPNAEVIDEVLPLLVNGFTMGMDDVVEDFCGPRSAVADGPLTRVVRRCSKLEHESLSNCVTLVVDALA